MFALSQTSASRLPLLSKLVHTALSVPDRPPSGGPTTKLLIFPSLCESYSCTKTMNNSHEIILFQKNPGGWGHLKLYLNS